MKFVRTGNIFLYFAALLLSSSVEFILRGTKDHSLNSVQHCASGIIKFKGLCLKKFEPQRHGDTEFHNEFLFVPLILRGLKTLLLLIILPL